MCNFFSLLSNGKGDIFYSTAEDREKAKMEGDISESHSHIASLYNNTEDRFNQWEFDPFKCSLRLDKRGDVFYRNFGRKTGDDRKIVLRKVMNIVPFEKLVPEGFLYKTSIRLHKEKKFITTRSKKYPLLLAAAEKAINIRKEYESLGFDTYEYNEALKFFNSLKTETIDRYGSKTDQVYERLGNLSFADLSEDTFDFIFAALLGNNEKAKPFKDLFEMGYILDAQEYGISNTVNLINFITGKTDHQLNYAIKINRPKSKKCPLY